MNPVYIDIHIHTSENPDNLNQNYPITIVLEKIQEMSQGASVLISFTDHNTINKKVYLDALQQKNENVHLLLGAELHIKNFDNAPAYHCHILFKNDISEDAIDQINDVLNVLYPRKVVSKMDSSIPSLDKIVKSFDGYDFILLPHGGQGHATFDTSIPKGQKFDSVMEKSIYYNQFEGYTARAQHGLDVTLQYFKRLGISDFINLVTCTDNYDPKIYPRAKNDEAQDFVPTWMFANPSFDGLRLSLSESSRFLYQLEKPESWSEHIKKVELQNENIDIDVELSSGLNVVIGGSSSGKTLFVDSLYRSLSRKENAFDDSKYSSYGVSSLNVYNPSGVCPHYISQNYITKIVNPDSEGEIENIDVIKSVFPDDPSFVRNVERLMGEFKHDVRNLIGMVEKIEQLEKDLRSLPHIGKLFVNDKIPQNVYEIFQPTDDLSEKIVYDKSKMQCDFSSLNSVKENLVENPFFDRSILVNFEYIERELKRLQNISHVHEKTINVIHSYVTDFKRDCEEKYFQVQSKTNQWNSLIEKIKLYVELNGKFALQLDKIADYSIKAESREIQSMGHKLSIENSFTLSKEVVLQTFNNFLKNKIQKYDDISPEMLYKHNYIQRPKVDSYEKFVDKVCEQLNAENRNKYKIVTKDGLDYDKLSPGWKTSVILDLILGYEKDFAPIIIDQPEDNLATSYINSGLVTAIKQVKKKKQIILVSHNATIPMMADAQTIVYCQNKCSKIAIKSAAMEGEIGTQKVVDLIAKITDGGKASIKKRVKKYDLKRFN